MRKLGSVVSSRASTGRVRTERPRRRHGVWRAREVGVSGVSSGDMGSPAGLGVG